MHPDQVAVLPTTETSRWEAGLRERDGACVDINFAECIPREAARALLAVVAGEWMSVAATDQEGKPVAPADLALRLDADEGALTTQWRGGLLIENVQLFLFWEAGEGVFAELTFFPDEIVDDAFDMSAFLALLGRMVAASGSGEYYVRRENASWRHGQAPTGDVIFSHREHPLGSGVGGAPSDP